MKGLRAVAVAVSVLALSMSAHTVKAAGKDKDKTPSHIVVAFGTGLNNSQPGNTPNHHILPQEFKVAITHARKLDGTVVTVPATVNFIVSGFHWPWVYKPGVTVEEVQAHIPTTTPPPLFINYDVDVFAKGVFPGTPPLFTDTPISPVSGAQNRTDSFAFSTPGKYLVICNVRPHFLDGMYAWVTVVDDDDDN